MISTRSHSQINIHKKLTKGTSETAIATQTRLSDWISFSQEYTQANQDKKAVRRKIKLNSENLVIYIEISKSNPVFFNINCQMAVITMIVSMLHITAFKA